MTFETTSVSFCALNFSERMQIEEEVASVLEAEATSWIAHTCLSETLSADYSIS
jgi:hypothetical protein